MAKNPLTTEQKLRQQIKALKRENEARKALRLEGAYPLPTPLDVKASLAASTDKTRFGQPYIEAWSINEGHSPRLITITALINPNPGTVFSTEAQALIAFRHQFARKAAERLADLDREIEDALEVEVEVVERASEQVSEAQPDAEPKEDGAGAETAA